jgi:apolipoprotein D and lipocalin family protein
MYFQRKCARDVTATYTLRDDGDVTVSNACVREDGVRMQSDGVARMAGSDPAKLEVRFAPAWLSFLPGVWADYWVLAIDADYQWAIVGEPDRKYLWILSRQPTMDAKTLEALKARARTMEYDLAELIISAPPA